jgi:hypothetical protein
MSVLHLRHIQKYLTELYGDHLDLSDAARQSTEQQNTTLLTRALAAFAVQSAVDCSPTTAAASVIDGYQDNGIDAIYADPKNNRIIIVQSKWSAKGTSTMSVGDVLKLISGTTDVLNLRSEKFNKRGQDIIETDLAKVISETDCRLELIVAHTSTQTLSDECRAKIKDFLVEINDTSEILVFREHNQRTIHQAASTPFEGSSISLDVSLQDWGRIEEPYKAFYGQVSAETVGKWWTQHRERIFAKNIRQFIPNSSINRNIANTLTDTPHDFWYMNNGITLLCEKIEKNILGGSDRNFGHFSCHGVSVINGAQTVGSIGRTYENNPAQASKARVFARFISLEDCPEDFASRVTVATNTQNRVQNRDFAALDPEQDRIRRELLFDDIDYVYKTGVPLPNPEQGFTIEDATIALACASRDLKMAVTAKSSLGSLWEVNKPQYRQLFNSGLTGPSVWEKVKIFYIVDMALRTMRGSTDLRNVAYHGNRFVLRQIFRIFDANHVKDPKNVDIEVLAKTVTQIIAPHIGSVVTYPPALFKSTDRCIQLEQIFDIAQIQIPIQEGIFDRQFRRAAETHPNYRPQTTLFRDEADVLS